MVSSVIGFSAEDGFHSGYGALRLAKPIFQIYRFASKYLEYPIVLYVSLFTGAFIA